MLTDVDVAYVAGFFDGEGSIGLYINGQGRGISLRTQLTQNVSNSSTALIGELIEHFGGNSTKQTTTHGVKYNWQLNGDNAARFLSILLPHLRGKREQALMAVAYQRLKNSLTKEQKLMASTLMKELKKQDIDQVMENQKDLVEIVATLKQVLCVKG